MKADETCVFWEKKLAENQQLLETLESDPLTTRNGEILDGQTLAETRQWVLRRIAECQARLADRAHTRRYV